MGAKGVGEPPTISSTPAVIAAIQDAMNTAYGSAPHLRRVPLQPSDVAKTVNAASATNVRDMSEEREILGWEQFGEASRELARMKPTTATNPK